MSVGIVILAHDHLYRTAQLANALVRDGCRVAIHLDTRVLAHDVDNFHRQLNTSKIELVERGPCEWGQFSLVQAGRRGAIAVLERWPDVSHVCLISGSCLPTRPLRELQEFLQTNLDTDFIESVPAEQGNWVQEGLSWERFTLFFPFSWRRQRSLFDAFVALQRKLGISRKIPKSLLPHIGSQWWCLSRQTLERIFDDPELPAYDRFFQRTWIPDEAYFQTLAHKHSRKLVARSLTFSRFDHQGKPFLFYDDHADALAELNAYFARKVWHHAGRLYARFLDSSVVPFDVDYQSGRMHTRLTEAVVRRTKGRPGLTMQSRHAAHRHEAQFSTHRPYSVFCGFERIFEGFQPWLSQAAPGTVHGRLFAPDRVEFAANEKFMHGNLVNNCAIRDYDQTAFLRNLIWNGRQQHQSFLFHTSDSAEIGAFLAADPNAQVFTTTVSWILDVYQDWTLDRTAMAQSVILRAQEEAARNSLFFGDKVQAKVTNWTLQEIAADPGRLFDEMARGMPGLNVKAPPSLAMPADFDEFLGELARHQPLAAKAVALRPGLEILQGMGRARRG